MFAGSLTGAPNSKSRPNLVFILTDDQRDNSFSAMGHPWVETPEIDKLLSGGIRFQNAYIAEPTCNPSRAALFLGNHERINRLGFSSKHRMSPAQWEDSYPALLQKAGYKTGYTGKWHVNIAGEVEGGLHGLFDYFRGHNGHGEFYHEKEQDGKTVTITTNRHHTDNALDFLRQQKSSDQPFCLSIGYATPHGSKVIRMHDPKEPANLNPVLRDHPIYGGKYRDLDIAYPLQTPENPFDHIPQSVMRQEMGRTGIYWYDYTPATNKEHHYRYYQMITEIDQMVGEIVAELDSLGLRKETIIIFGSDHGLLMGEYGMGGKGLLYDLTMKFPCFIYDPNASEKVWGTSTKLLVSSLDIPVTLLDYAGVEPAPFMTGRSLKPLVEGAALEQPWRDGLFLENMYVGRDTPLQEGYVTQEWKYIRYKKVQHETANIHAGLYTNEEAVDLKAAPVFEMLFSLKNDPDERENLAQKSSFSTVLEDMRSRCHADLENLITLRKDYAERYNLTKQ
ncbi:sulfatase-like hydrolase/transferase [Coraliomargarita akajimensis]|nr:sulfatase-like hydrolase/transferase [Coraliomargarita akajimensis]